MLTHGLCIRVITVSQNRHGQTIGITFGIMQSDAIGRLRRVLTGYKRTGNVRVLVGKFRVVTSPAT